MKKDKVGNPMGLATDILKLLKEEPRQTPGSIKEKVNFSISATRNVLMVLSDLGLVETKVRGLYEITPLGEHVLKNTVKEMKGEHISLS